MKASNRKPGVNYINDHPLYATWSMIRQRCNNPKHTYYHIYGGRGVRVCNRWDSFLAFVEDVGPRPSPKHTIDRYPNRNGNYEPSNVRWASLIEQARNRNPRGFHKKQSATGLAKQTKNAMKTIDQIKAMGGVIRGNLYHCVNGNLQPVTLIDVKWPDSPNWYAASVTSQFSVSPPNFLFPD